MQLRTADYARLPGDTDYEDDSTYAAVCDGDDSTFCTRRSVATDHTPHQNKYRGIGININDGEVAASHHQLRAMHGKGAMARVSISAAKAAGTTSMQANGFEGMPDPTKKGGTKHGPECFGPIMVANRKRKHNNAAAAAALRRDDPSVDSSVRRHVGRTKQSARQPLRYGACPQGVPTLIRPPSCPKDPNHLDDKWDDKFQALIRYKATHGHTNVPVGTWADLETLDDPDSKVPFAIGWWVQDQRKAYKKGKLKPEREDKLLEQGFKFRGTVRRAARPSDQIERNSNGRAKERNCTVAGCIKMGCGRRTNYMCTWHYKESRGEKVGQERRPREKNRPSDQIERDSNGRAKGRNCTVAGCTKMGQGRRFNYMCCKHYNESK